MLNTTKNGSIIWLWLRLLTIAFFFGSGFLHTNPQQALRTAVPWDALIAGSMVSFIFSIVVMWIFIDTPRKLPSWNSSIFQFAQFWHFISWIQFTHGIALLLSNIFFSNYSKGSSYLYFCIGSSLRMGTAIGVHLKKKKFHNEGVFK